MTKSCTLCNTARPVLVRCQIDATGKWHFVCPGACWKAVSGGVEDAKGLEEEYPHYRYGGMWKDRSADGPVSAKKPKKVKQRQKEEMRVRGEKEGAEDEEGRDGAAEGEGGKGRGEGGEVYNVGQRAR